MALPTIQRSTFDRLLWLRKFGAAFGRPFFAIVLAMFAGSIVIMITSPGSPGDRFNAALAAYEALFTGSFGDPQSISYTLVKVTPLILTGLSVAIAFRAGLFNIGAEGQLAVGAMTAGVIAFKATTWPGWLLIPTMLIGSMLAGAIWGGIAGILKAWRGAHEVVTTIMLNWIAFYVTDYLIDVTFKAPQQADQTPAIPLQATLPQISVFYNNTLGAFLPKIADPQQYFVDVGFFLALIVLVIYWFIVSRTTFGYEIRVIGQNIKAARYAGMPIKRNISLSMAIAGAFSGLAGSIHLMGQFPYQLIGSTFRLDTTGFDAIGVALLGRNTAIGVLLASLLFGGLRQGASLMQLNANVPADLVFIIQALVLFSIASEFLPVIQRSLPRWSGLWRRPALVPPLQGTSVVAIPQHGDNLPVPDTVASSQNGAGSSDGMEPAERSPASTGDEGSDPSTKVSEED